MQKIIPHLWYDKEAKEASEFYVKTFGGDSKIISSTILNDTPSGQVEIINFEIFGYAFSCMSAGALFKFNPSISFHVKCKSSGEVDEIYNKLSQGGKTLMPLDKYDFSERYAWVEDKYGLSWQIIQTSEDKVESRIIPVIMFVGEVCGKAKEAIEFYVETFENSVSEFMMPYGEGMPNEKPENMKYAAFKLEGQEFGAMDSGQDHKFQFNEAISFQVNCKDQEEVDYFWDKISAVPEAEQCGWIKDKFGVSWQIVPIEMEEMMKADREKLDKITQAFLEMKKIDIEELKRVANE